MNEIVVAIPLAIAAVFSIYVYFSLRKMIKETAQNIEDPLFEKLGELVTLTHADWIKKALEIVSLVESRENELVITRPEIVTFSFATRQHIASLGISPAPINPAWTEDFYKTVGTHLEAYVNAQTSGKKAKAKDEMLRLQAFMVTH